VTGAIEDSSMTTRIVLGPEFVRALRVRGLTIAEVARTAKVSEPTVSAALHGRRINTGSALRICRAVAATPVVAELDAWLADEAA
jgi:transcriptional regulator with XRE-family HTH domain